MFRPFYQIVSFLLLFWGASLTAQNCDLPLPLSDSCATAPVFCSTYLDQFCSSTGAPNDFNPAISNSCALENSIWVQIPVCETEVELSFLVENCLQSGGLEVTLASSDDCENFVAAAPGCFSLPNNATTSVEFIGLTPNQLYYLIIDGNTADVCDFLIEVVSGVAGTDTIMTPDTTTVTPLMWEVVTAGYIEGEPDACISDGNYRFVPPVCILVEGDCMRATDNSNPRMMADSCDVPGYVCPPPIPTEFDTIIHWTIPPCVEFVGDTTTFDVVLNFDNYLQCYINSGNPFPIDSIPFEISAEMELIPIIDSTTSAGNPIFCNCNGTQSQICNSCPSGASLPGYMRPQVDYAFEEVCPSCGPTPYGFFCPGDFELLFVNSCEAMYIIVGQYPDDDIDFGTFEICPGECVTVETFTFCGAGSYTFPTFNEFGCEVLGLVELVEFPAAPVDFGSFVTCPGECIQVDTETFCGEGSYTWQTTTVNGCLVPATATILSPAVLEVSMTGGDIDCYSPSTTLSVSASGGSAPYSYQWSLGNGVFSSITVSSGGTYTCTVTDELGCENVASFTVSEDFELPLINLTTPNNTLSAINPSTEILTNISINSADADFEWLGPNGIILPTGNPSSIEAMDAGTYSVTVTDLDNGCTSEAAIEIFQSVLPPEVLFKLGDSCTYAPFFCAEFLDGALANNELATHDSLDLIPGCPMDNSLWLSFAACDSTAQLSFFVDSCLQAQGLEFTIASTADCDSFDIIGDPCQTVANGILDTLSFDSLTIGNIYYLIIDGIDADICDFEIGVISGVAGGLDSIPSPPDTTQYRLEQITPGSIDGPTEVCAFTDVTYTFNPGICGVVEGDCNRADGDFLERSAADICDFGCINDIELDTSILWTLPNGTTIVGDSTDFDITINFGLDFLQDYYNGMIPASDTDTIVVTLFANYNISVSNDTMTQDTTGMVYCHCPGSQQICGSCSTGAQLDVSVIVIFDEDARTTCIDECQGSPCGEICPGEVLYCTSPCMMITVSLEFVPGQNITYTDYLDCNGTCIMTPYGQFCDAGVYELTIGCDEITITIDPGNPMFIDYGTVTLCPGDCFIANDGQQLCDAGINNFSELDQNGCNTNSTVNIIFENISDIDLGTEFLCFGDCFSSPIGPICDEGIHTWSEDQNGCTINYTIDIVLFSVTPIDYGVVTLCPGECFTVNNGQTFCTEGVHNFTEVTPDGCTVDATLIINYQAIAALSASPVTELCSAANDNYQVSFTIYGDPPFSVNGVELAGDFYASADIASGAAYSFEIKNSQANCPNTIFINGSYNCPLLICDSDPGQLFNAPNSLCVSQSFNINEISPVQLQDATFGFDYLLHADPDPLTGPVLMRNKTGIFEFDPVTLLTEKEYYSSRIVGQLDNGLVDLMGNCLNFTAGPAVTFYAEPEMQISPADNLMLNCHQETIELTALATAGSGVWQFQWSIPGIPSTAATITVSDSGLYSCLLTDQLSGCQVYHEVTVEENFAQPTVAILEPQGMLNCQVAVLELVADVSPPDTTVDLQWTGPNGDFNPDNPLLVAAQKPGWYFLNTIHAESGCTAVDSVEVRENDNVPTGFDALIVQPECYDQPQGSVEILGVQGGTPPFDLFVDEIATNGTIENLVPGNYTISTIDGEGCEHSQEIEIIAPMEFSSNLDQSISVEYGETIELDAGLNFVPTTVTWTDDLGNVLGNLEVLSTDFFSSQKISLYAADENGCAINGAIEIMVKELEAGLYIPSAFSPNGDEINNYFEIFSNESIVQIDQLQIFNRWGAMVFRAENYIPGSLNGRWDGRSNGKALNPGVFVYQVIFTMQDGKQQTQHGDVLLIK